MLHQVVGQLGRPRIERLPRAARALGQSEVVRYTFEFAQMFAVIVMVVTHLRDWDAKIAL